MDRQEQYRNRAEQVLLHTYSRFPVVIERGQGVYLYDTEGRAYLDFGAGIAVSALGYGDADYEKALVSQIGKVIHTSNLYYHIPGIEAGEKFLKASGMDRVFFTNSGAEAVEGAIKAARKYGKKKYGQERYEVIAMEHSFHGRTIGALSVTGNEKYQEPFRPLMGGVRFAAFNDLDSVKKAVSEKTCGIIVETIQGEGGIYPASQEFLEGLKELCVQEDILLIFDEIQCGMGRTGTMFAWQGYGVKPDIMTSAKALGCGVPVGAFAMTEKTAAFSLEAGDHGTTYGGNPFACAAVSKVFDRYEQLGILEHVRKVGPYLEARLEELVSQYGCLKERRGTGLMQGVEAAGIPAGEIINRALDQGLLLLSAGNNSIRFVPPLVIETVHIDKMVKILHNCLKELG